MKREEPQKTINQEVIIKGEGLHTGRQCQAVFKPGPPNSGIQFMRSDLPGSPMFPAKVDHVVDMVRGTTLGVGENRVYTIEHILAALGGLGVDNLVVELDDTEPPVADGSAKDFSDALLSVGFTIQDAPRQFFSVDEPVEYVSNNTVIRLEPADELEIRCQIDYQHPLLQKQEWTFSEKDDFAKEIAPARTFCFDYEIEGLKKKGLAKGGSLDNTIVIGPTGIYNAGPFLRFDNEFVRHKILDLMGDLTLLGFPILGRLYAQRCGHGHNIKFLKHLIHQKTATSPVSVG